MGDASFLQTSFVGGEFSPAYQGRVDDEDYRKGMNVCLNGLPIEEGAWQRRAGTRLVSSTRNGLPGRVLPFAFNNAQPWLMEFTDGHLRFNDGRSLLLDTSPPVITAVSTDNPAVVTTKTAHGWTAGDSVVFLPNSSQKYLALALINRQFIITPLTTTTFALYDALTNQPFDGSALTWVNNPGQVARVTDIPTVYAAGAWTNVRKVQNQNLVMLLHGSYIPYVLQATPPSSTAAPIFTIAKAVFQDGPYMDAAPSGTVLNYVSGSTFTLGYQTYAAGTPYSLGDMVTFSGTVYQSIQGNNAGNTPNTSPSFWTATSGFPGVNGGQGFLSTDLGRLIRLYQQPADWAVGTAYTAGQSVTYNNAFYTALVNTTGAQPDTSPDKWEVVVNTSVASWVWGEISAITNNHQITIFLHTPLINTLTVKTWRLGLYSDTTGYPTCGCFHQGRFWLAGAQPNRIDATCSNAFPPAGWTTAFNMAPSSLDGTVSDDNGLSFVFESDETDNIVWVIPDHQGLVCGTAGGEWSLQASNLSDPITPTSVQAHKVTKYKAANIEAVRTGLSFCFAQLHQRKLMEYVADVYSGKYSGTNVSKRAKHLTGSGIAEIAYQQETIPVVWVRGNDGSLVGCTYKRESPFSTQPASFFGWHRHALGTGRSVLSIASGPSPDGGVLDSLSMVTQDPSTGYCWIETLQRLFDEDVPTTNAWEVDGATIPVVGTYTAGTPDTITLYGMSLYAGKSVDITFGGQDIGTYTVSATGTVVIQVGTGTAALLTQSWLQSVSNSSLTNAVTLRWGAGAPAPATTTTKTYLPGNGDADDTWNFCIDTKRRRAWGAAQYSGAAFGAERVHVYDLDTQAVLAILDSNGLWDVAFGPGVVDAATGDFFCFARRWTTPGGVLNSANSIFRLRYSSGAITIVRRVDLPSAWSGASPDQPTIGITVGSTTYVAMPSLSSLLATAVVAVIDPSSGIQVGATYTGMLEKNPMMAPGSSSATLGTFFSLGTPAAATTYILGVYKYTLDYNRVFSGTRLGQITAPNVDGTWTNADNIAITGFAYDKTDGNLIGLFNNITRTKIYLVKINVQGATPFVQWKLDVGTWAPATSNVDFPQSNTENGKVLFVSGTTLHTVDSATGTDTTSATSFSSLVSQRWDDNTGMMWWRGSTNWNTNGVTAGQALGSGVNPPYYVPVCVGTTFTSQGQILRAIHPQEAGAQNGPALTKTRRSQSIGVLLNRSQGMSVGTTFDKLRPLDFRTPGGTRYAANSLFSGPMWATLEDAYTFDSMVCWQVTRPWPATVLAVEPFLHTTDR